MSVISETCNETYKNIMTTVAGTEKTLMENGIFSKKKKFLLNFRPQTTCICIFPALFVFGSKPLSLTFRS